MMSVQLKSVGAASDHELVIIKMNGFSPIFNKLKTLSVFGANKFVWVVYPLKESIQLLASSIK